MQTITLYLYTITCFITIRYLFELIRNRRQSNNSSEFGPHREKTYLRRFANSKCADQPAHPRSLISVFVIRVLKSTISKLTISEFSIF